MITIFDKLIYDKFFETFGKEAYASDNRFKIIQHGMNVFDDTDFRLVYSAQLKDLLSKNDITLISTQILYSIAIANRRLREANKMSREANAPHFTDKERFTNTSTPVPSWKVEIHAKLRPAKSDFYILDWNITICTGPGIIYLPKHLFSHIDFPLAGTTRAFADAQKGIEQLLSNLDRYLLDKVTFDNYEAPGSFFPDTMPLAYVFDAVRSFTDYPNSIPEKLHVRC